MINVTPQDCVDYARSIAPIMGLGAWEIRLGDGYPSVENANISILTELYDDVTSFHFRDDFFLGPLAEIKFGIVHELCHLVFARYCMLADEIAMQFGPQTYMFIENRMKIELEISINRMTRILVDRLPDMPYEDFILNGMLDGERNGGDRHDGDTTGPWVPSRTTAEDGASVTI